MQCFVALSRDLFRMNWTLFVLGGVRGSLFCPLASLAPPHVHNPQLLIGPSQSLHKCCDRCVVSATSTAVCAPVFSFEKMSRCVVSATSSVVCSSVFSKTIRCDVLFPPPLRLCVYPWMCVGWPHGVLCVAFFSQVCLPCCLRVPPVLSPGAISQRFRLCWLCLAVCARVLHFTQVLLRQDGDMAAVPQV